MTGPQHLVAMANQIARNLAAQGEESAIAQTAQHITDFWDPRMKAGIAAEDRSSFSPIVSRALDLLQGT